MKKAPRFNFTQACTDMLLALGAKPGEHDPWQLHTLAGVLRLQPYDNWLACRFDDVEAAKQHAYFGHLNPYSGKWNWHFTEPNAEDVEFLREQIQRLLPQEAEVR